MPWVQLALWANFVQLLQLHRLFGVTFHFGFAFVSRHVCLNQKFIEVITYAKRNELIHIVFTTEGLFELVIESWSDGLTGRAIRLWVHLALRASFVQLLQFQHLFSVDFVSAIAFVSRHVCFNQNFIEVMTWV